jgi:hypothetical protein
MENIEERQFDHIFNIILLFNLLFFHIFHIFSLFKLPFFYIVHILSLFDLPFFHIFPVKRFGKYRRKLKKDRENIEEK